jgi:serine/threonine-protein kinase
MIGERLGKWAIFKELGRGGMGSVYLAQEEVTGRTAALKVLAADLAQDVGFLQRFQGEIETLSKLDHPSIVRFYEAGYENGLHFFAMEYVDGQSLEKVLNEQGRLNWPEVLDIALKVCSALRHVHDSGVIHRDIKPPNILRTADGVVKLTDFGIARIFASRHLTATGGVVGTAEFLSPEQAAGKPVTKRSDIYSLGVVLYMLLTGRAPFEGTSFLDLLHKHRYAQFDKPGRFVPEIPYEIDELVCELLEKEPDKRPPDCLVLARKIENIRRRLARKNNLTSLGGDEATIAENRVDRLPLDSRPGPATLMSRLVRNELDSQNQGGLISRMFNSAFVLVPLFVLCVGTIVYAFWPASAESLYNHGSQAMESSSNVRDWEHAWEEYFEPLNTRYPDHPYKEQVEAYRSKIDAKRSPFMSEPQRIYLQGEARLKDGDLAGAQKTWQNLLLVFGDDEKEKTWVVKAVKGLEKLDEEGKRKDRWQNVRPALEKAARLARENNRADAMKIWTAIQALYHDDPFAQDTILVEVKQAIEATQPGKRPGQ